MLSKQQQQSVYPMVVDGRVVLSPNEKRQELSRAIVTIGVLVALAAIALGVCACSPMVYTRDVPNLVRVDDRVYRGGQPRSQDGWDYLCTLGVKTVIKLNSDEEGEDTPLCARVINLPLRPRDGHPEDIFTEPSGEYLRLITQEIDASPGKVFVHCSHGQDRTGLVIAIYRVRHGYPKAWAQNEMHRLHFHWELPGLSWAWREYSEGGQ